VEVANGITTTFERRRAVVWVCDIQGSTASLNNPDAAPYAEEFLKRFFWLSAVLVRSSGGFMAKWTGDGFVAAYDVPLDRDLMKIAIRTTEAAFQSSLLVNVTHLGVEGRPGSLFRFPRKFRLRHGIAYEPDALIVRHSAPDEQSTDIIGRSVVLAFRLSGIRAPFPGIVAHRTIVESARDGGTGLVFKKLRLRAADVLKHFKGERWATRQLYATDDSPSKARPRDVLVRQAKAALAKATGKAPSAPSHWITTFLAALRCGPPSWAPALEKELVRHVHDELVVPLQRFIDSSKARGQKRA